MFIGYNVGPHVVSGFWETFFFTTTKLTNSNIVGNETLPDHQRDWTTRLLKDAFQSLFNHCMITAQEKTSEY